MIQSERFKEIVPWLLSDDRGISSETILACALGMKPNRGYVSSYPRDPADLGRCIRLLESCDWIRDPSFETLTKKGSNAWRNLIQFWDELEKLYFEELPAGKAPKTYTKMKELIEGKL